MHSAKKNLMPFDKLKKAVEEELTQVNKIITEAAKSHAEFLPAITQHLMSSGGKRLRPILTITCGKLFGISNDDHIKLAAAVEFIHTATLLHDDVIDKSNMRRGQKTANNIWGNKASILVGDYLLSQSFMLMVATNNIKTLEMLSKTAALITESEIWQLELLNNINLTIEEYIKLITGKTAVLFAAACAVSAIVTNQPQEVIDMLYRFGLNLGICFQVTDDTLDYLGTNKKFGKKIGNDFLEGKITLPFIVTYKAATPNDKKRIELIFSNRNQNAFSEFLELFFKYNGNQQIAGICEKYNQAGQNEIKRFYKNSLGTLLSNALAYSSYRDF